MSTPIGTYLFSAVKQIFHQLTHDVVIVLKVPDSNWTHENIKCDSEYFKFPNVFFFIIIIVMKIGTPKEWQK